MVEFKVINKETMQDESEHCFIANDGKYYFVYYDYIQLSKQEVDLKKYDIIEKKTSFLVLFFGNLKKMLK